MGLPAMVFFESWRGRYADSPRAISVELRRRRPDLRQVWSVEAEDAGAPADLSTVRRNSPAYFVALAAASHVVTNDILTRYPLRRPGARYLQTWHGTPLKRIGLDVEVPPFPGADVYRRRLVKDISRWDYLLSPSPYCSSTFRKAFHYQQEILELGAPRNDILRSPDAARLRDEVRRRLDIPEGRRAILYAPTWRDENRASDGRPRQDLRLDLALMEQELREDSILLIRQHRVVSNSMATSLPAWARDVSDHAEVQELCLAADLLVTDYSSLMFDFVLTGRPILLFCYDLAAYARGVRGFYLDFPNDAPGPVAASTHEVVENINQLAQVQSAWARRYAEFAQRYCPLDDGAATTRVVDAVFGAA